MREVVAFADAVKRTNGKGAPAARPLFPENIVRMRNALKWVSSGLFGHKMKPRDCVIGAASPDK
ncbi:hypothetical protein CFI11_07685 [Thalassococcus sp. S3]|nr:hypothetical protein CFI11_07685 [Thalassococcus sp. S3]